MWPFCFVFLTRRAGRRVPGLRGETGRARARGGQEPAAHHPAAAEEHAAVARRVSRRECLAARAKVNRSNAKRFGLVLQRAFCESVSARQRQRQRQRQAHAAAATPDNFKELPTEQERRIYGILLVKCSESTPAPRESGARSACV